MYRSCQLNTQILYIYTTNILLDDKNNIKETLKNSGMLVQAIHFSKIQATGAQDLNLGNLAEV